jgi:hypothetical protein
MRERKEIKKKRKREGKEVDRGKTHLYRAEAPPGTNVRHLYQVSCPVQMLHHICTGCFVIPGTNDGYEPVQMPIFPVVSQLFFWRCD